MFALLAAATAFPASLDDRTVAWVEAGYVLDQPAIAFGAAHRFRQGPFVAAGSAGVGTRATFIEDHPQDPPFALATVSVALGSPWFGLVALVDAAVLPAAEEDCGRFGGGCRHRWWVGTDDWLGVSVQPGGGLRFAGDGPSGASWVFVLGLQPYQRYQSAFQVLPRVDLVASVGPKTTFHAWVGRYGVAIGLGRVLGR